MSNNGKTDSKDSSAVVVHPPAATTTALPPDKIEEGHNVNAAPLQAGPCAPSHIDNTLDTAPATQPNHIERLSQELSDTLKHLRESDHKKRGIARFAEIVDSFKTVSSAIIIIIIALFLVVGVIRGLTRDVVVIESFDLPQDLQQQGFDSHAISSSLADRLRRNIEVAKTSFKGMTFDPAPYEPLSDLEVPGVRTSINSVTQYIGELFGRVPTRISGEIVEEGGRLNLTVRIRNKKSNGPRTSSSSFQGERAQFDDLLDRAAEFVMKQTEPYVLASYFYEKGRGDMAQDLAQHCLHVEPAEDDPYSYILLGLIRQDKNDYDGAIANFQKAEKFSNPGTKSLAYVDEGLARTAKKDFVGAQLNYDEAINCEPNSARAYNARGWTLMQENRYQEAIPQLNKALTIEPGYILAYENLANIYAYGNDLNAASGEYEKAVGYSQAPAVTYEHWGDLLMDNGKYDEAIEKFQMSVALDPNLRDAIYDWGDALIRRGRDGDIEEAQKQFQKIISIEPGYALAHLGMAEALGMKRNHKGADSEFNEAIRLNSNCPQCLAQSHYMYGNVLKGIGDVRGALEHYREAAKITPDSKYGTMANQVIRDLEHTDSVPRRQRIIVWNDVSHRRFGHEDRR